MPALFSKRSAKSKGISQGPIKAVLGSTTPRDSERLELVTPSPSFADARPLPALPSKDSLPPLPLSTNNSYLNLNSGENGSYSIGAQHAEFGQLDVRALKAKVSSPDFQNRSDGRKGNSQASAFGSLRRSKSKTAESLRPLSPPMPSSAMLSSRSLIEAKKVNETYAYGYTPLSTEVQLDSSKVLPILEACGEQIRRRGLDSPLIFSSMALDLSPDHASSLVRAYFTGSAPAGRQALPPGFLEEVQYANPHDLAAMIKWAFARLGRVLAVPVPSSLPSKKGEVREEMFYIQQRGFLDLDLYFAWRESERRSRYPADSFNLFSRQLSPGSAQLLSSLFSLLSSTASYSLKNGMVPSRLSKHFGPLLFGLPEDETFARTYDAFVRASNATEHLFLAYIRNQAVATAQPPKLMDHVAGYPSILAGDAGLPGKHAKMVPVTQIERQVRLYSPDLIQTACETDLDTQCPEWEACFYDNERLGRDPQLTDRFRKLVNLRGGGAQGRRKAVGGMPGLARQGDGDHDVEAHGSLVSKQWSDFMSDGFTAPDSSKLNFDLNESARKTRHQKRDTMQWNDFQTSGFGFADDGLDVALSFDEGLKQEVENWPGERDRIVSKMRERQKALPPFHYDTTPRLIASPTRAGEAAGSSEGHPVSSMDEAFADIWADYLIGAGWSNRDELTHRTANFAVLQYKSRPGPSTVGSQSAGSSLAAPTRFIVPRRDENGQDIPEDPRTDAAWFVIQEVVPQLYRAELEVAGRGKGKGSAMVRKFNLFRSKKDRIQDDAALLEDDPFRPGVGGETKHIRLSDVGRTARVDSLSQYEQKAEVQPLRSMSSQGQNQLVVPEADATGTHGRTSMDSSHAQFRSEGSNGAGHKLMSTLRAKSMRVVKGSKKGGSSSEGVSSHDSVPQNSSRQVGGHAGDVSFISDDFETRSLHDSDEPDLVEDGVQHRKRKNLSNLLSQEKRESKDDAWIDVLFKANGNRMSEQDVAWREPKRTNAGAVALVTGPTVLGAAPEATFHGSVKGCDPSLDTFTSRDPSHTPDSPRASTTPQAAVIESSTKTSLAPTLGLELERIDSRSSSHAEQDYRYLEERSASTMPHPPIRGYDTADESMSATAALVDISTSQTSPFEASPSASEASPSRLALKPIGNLEKPKSTIDTKALVESLRAGLSPVEAVRKSKLTPASPTAEPSAARIDPFAKDRTSGRVASVASRFGGPTGKNVAKLSLEPLSPNRSVPISPPPKSPKRALAAAAASAAAPSPTSAAASDPTTASGSLAAPMSPPRRRAPFNDAEPLSPTRSIDSYADQDSIYPEDAASNYHDSGEQAEDGGLDLQEQEVVDDSAPSRAMGTRQWRLVPRSGDNGQGFAEDRGRGEEEDQVYAIPSGFREPYQPGMPLDNVMEESESVLSGSNL